MLKKTEKWEERLKSVFDEIDGELEREYQGRYPLRPARPDVGVTSNPEMDGLFNVGACFTAGFGSEYGRGYIVQIQLATLSRISEDIQEEIKDKVADKLSAKLPSAFPGKALQVERDGYALKIFGDLSLD